MSRLSVLSAVVAVVGAMSCGVETDQNQNEVATGTSAQDLKGTLTFTEIPKSGCRTVTIHPDATGTVRSAPAMNMLQVAPVGAAVESMYFDSVALGPESRRGVAEFSVPALNGRIEGASLSFTDSHGWQLQAVPTDWHNLNIYSAADNTVTADDYAREGAPFATFSTDMNALKATTHTFDVTGNVAAGQSTGFRIALQRNPSNASFAGSAFVDFSLDLRLCDEAALPGGTLSGRPGAQR